MKTGRKPAVHRGVAKASAKSDLPRRESRAKPAFTSEAGDHFRALFENARDVIFILAGDGRITSLNRSFETFTGWSREKWLGHSFEELIVKEDRSNAREQFNRVLEGESPRSIRLRVKSLARKIMVVEINMSPQIDRGEVVGALGIARDMTEEQRTQDALRANEAGLQVIFNNVPVSIWVEDFSGVKKVMDSLRSEGVKDIRKYLDENPSFVRKAARMVKVLDVNQDAMRLFGATKKEQLLGRLDKILTSKALSAFRDELMAIAEGKTHFEGETQDESLQGMPLYLWRTIFFPQTTSGFDRVLVCLTDLTEHKQTETALRESDARLLKVLEASPIPITVNSLEGGVILYGNSALEQLMGSPLAEIIGAKVADYYADPKERSHLLADLSRNGSLRDREMSFRKPDGTTLWVSLSSERIVLDGRDCILSSFYDLSERKRSEVLQSAIYQISEAANKSYSMDEFFKSIHAIIGQVMPAENFYVALFDEANDLLSFPYYVDELDGSASIPASKPGRGMTEYVIRTGKALLSDAANFEQLARMGEVELVGPASPIWIGVPLIVEKRTIGVIALQDYHNPKVYTERELRMLEYVSGQVAKAIERKRLSEDITRNNRILSALQEATVPIMSETELSEVLQAILVQATGLFDTSSGYVYLVTPNKSELVLAMALGQGKKFLGTRLKPSEGLAGKVLETGGPVNIADYQKWEKRSKIFERLNLHAIVGVPLLSGSRVTGVLGISYEEEGRTFSQEDVELLSRFAQLASIALENARLYTLNKQELEERKITDAALREAEAKYRTVVEHISAITYTAKVDEAKTRLYVSPQIETLLGYTQEEYITDNTLWKRLLHPDDRERVLAEAKYFYETGEPFVSDYRSIARDGRVLWFHDEAVLYEDHTTHTRFIQGIKVDITQRKQADAIQAAMYRISDAAGANISMHEFYRAVHESLRTFMTADNFFIALYDDVTDLLSFPYHVDEFDDTPKTAPLGHGPTAYVIRHGIPLLGRSETMQRLEDAGVLIPAGTRSTDWLGVPLKINGRTIGVMAAQTYATGLRYDTPDLEIFSFVSGQVAASMERKQAQEALEASESRYRLSAKATNDVIWEWDIIAKQEVWSENLYSIFGYSLEEAGNDPGWWDRHIYPQDCNRVLDSLTAIFDGEGSIWECEYRFICKDDSIAHVIDRGYIERDYDGVPVRMIGAMADITERKHREEELESLAKASAALRVAGSRAEILTVVLDQVIQLVDASGAALALIHSGSRDLEVEAARGAWAVFEGTQVPMNGSPSGQAIQTGLPYVTHDVQNDPHVHTQSENKARGGFISVPLTTPDGMIGTLNVVRPSVFNEQDVRLLTNIADMAANAIQRASAYEQVKQQIERLKAQRTIDMFIASGTELHLTFQTILKQTALQLGADAASILMLNPSSHTLEFETGIGLRTRALEQVSLRMGEGFAGQAALTREAIRVDDLSSHADHPLHRHEGFIFYYGIPLIAKGEVKGVMEVFHRAKLNVDHDWLDFCESLAGQAALAIDNSSLFDSLQRSNLELGLAYETTLEGWSAALDLRDKETEGHTQRVTDLTLMLADAMGISDRERIQIRRGALLHDIGKMGIPDRILLKPDSLTEDEWHIMRQHPVYAYKLLSQIKHLRPALEIPYSHHERWDGTGYPLGLKGESIPLSARIFSVADVYDALCSDRPYRPAWTTEKAINYIKSLSGVHFDPRVVDVFMGVVQEYQAN